jgi:CheY-like chemotaxis protein
MSKPLIMIIDDEPDFIDVLTMTLSDDYRLHAFTNPLEAIDHVSNGELRAVLTDISMPQIRGTDLVRAIRGRNKNVPIVLVTGLSRQDQEVQAALIAGGNEVLVKPIRDLNLIIETVGKLVAHDRQQ